MQRGLNGTNEGAQNKGVWAAEHGKYESLLACHLGAVFLNVLCTQILMCSRAWGNDEPLGVPTTWVRGMYVPTTCSRSEKVGKLECLCGQEFFFFFFYIFGTHAVL